jgi:hypothetical protein
MLCRISADMLALRAAQTRLSRSVLQRHVRTQALQPRCFSGATHVRIAQRSAWRPQVPYLSQPLQRSPNGLLGPNAQLARVLSTETRRYIGEQVYLVVKYSAALWLFLFLSGLAYMGVDMERRERANPTPDDWSFWPRFRLRSVRSQMQSAATGETVLDWVGIGSSLRRALGRLEDRTGDGKGLVDAETGGILVDGVGHVGVDIRAKSWPWRSGYFEVIMGCAAAAEHMDGKVVDRTRGIVFPADTVIGPSNPDPRPLPPYKSAAPLEENCDRAFEPPETYYMRVVTGIGFTVGQKLDAALAYANWLEFKGLSDSAEEMYKWGIDIAKGALPATSTSGNVIDSDSYVLQPNATEQVTPNLLRATTALAIHRARTGDVSSALPILLSVLRARRSAPVSPFPRTSERVPSPQAEVKTDIAAASSVLRKLFRPTPYPPPPPSGDLPIIRETAKPTCDESELMLYIGEILFTTSPAAAGEGLGWTRQAVTVAEANLQSEVATDSEAKARLAKCKSCLQTGIDNWETMLRQITEQQVAASAREGARNAGWLEWRGWFGQDGGMKGKTMDVLHAGVLEEELKQVEALKRRMSREEIGSELNKIKGASGAAGTGVWIGG